MPVRQYLDNTVVPIILQAMTELAKERYRLKHLDLTIPSSLLHSIYLIIRMAKMLVSKRSNDFDVLLYYSTDHHNLQIFFYQIF